MYLNEILWLLKCREGWRIGRWSRTFVPIGGIICSYILHNKQEYKRGQPKGWKSRKNRLEMIELWSWWTEWMTSKYIYTQHKHTEKPTQKWGSRKITLITISIIFISHLFTVYIPSKELLDSLLNGSYEKFTGILRFFIDLRWMKWGFKKSVRSWWRSRKGLNRERLQAFIKAEMLEWCERFSCSAQTIPHKIQ
jgi:hypothetical protein